MSLPNSLMSSKALSLLLACTSLGLVAPQMGLANTTTGNAPATTQEETWKYQTNPWRNKAMYTFWYNKEDNIKTRSPNVSFQYISRETKIQTDFVFGRRNGITSTYNIKPVLQISQKNYFLEGYTYRKNESYRNYPLPHGNEFIYGIIKSNHKDHKKEGEPNYYLTFGSWLYVHGPNSYIETGSIVQGPEIDYTPGTWGLGIHTLTGTAKYYHEKGAGGLYGYKGQYQKFETDVGLAVYFGAATAGRAGMEGCIGCKNGILVSEDGETIRKQITLNYGTQLGNVTAFNGSTSVRGEAASSGQWQARMSTVPKDPKDVGGRVSIPRLTAGTFNAEWTASSEGDKAQITGYFVAPLKTYQPPSAEE